MKTNELILHIKTPSGWDHVKFVEDLSNQRHISFAGCDIGLVSDIFASFREEIATEVSRVGLSNLLRRQYLMEALVAPGQSGNFVKSIMVKFLQAIGVDEELIIVDPYFFASPHDTAYPALVEDILRPFANTIHVLKIVTLPNKVDSALKQSIMDRIQKLNAKLRVVHATSADYHDRFWITAKRANGILSGSSLNGLGKRYAIVDRLASNDVTDIVTSLKTANLI